MVHNSENAPTPRSGCAATTDGKNVYVFGGKDAEKRMFDLWEFSLTDFKYREMEKQGDVPPERNGHTMEHFEGKLYVFGGIHDITWELDDLHIYNLTVLTMEYLEKEVDHLGAGLAPQSRKEETDHRKRIKGETGKEVTQTQKLVLNCQHFV